MNNKAVLQVGREVRLTAFGTHTRFFGLYIFKVLDYIDEEDTKNVTICDGNKEIISYTDM